MQTSEFTYQRKDLPSSISKIGMTLLVVGIVLGVAAFFVDHTRAVYNYLIAFTFMISIGVGALFLISLEYIVGADWSVPIRRVVEFFAAIIPLLALLVIPLLLNVGELFHWSHPEAVAEDKILNAKAPYLNVSFFIIRVFVLIGLLAVLNYYNAGYVNLKAAGIMIITFLIGSYFSSKFAINLPEGIIKKVFAVFLLFYAVKLFFGK